MRSGADFRLSASSPAIDEGDRDFTASTDLDGAARPIGAGPDIGCYESPYRRRVKISNWKEVR